MKTLRFIKQMCDNASSAELGCFIGFTGIFVMATGLVLYALVLNIIN